MLATDRPCRHQRSKLLLVLLGVGVFLVALQLGAFRGLPIAEAQDAPLTFQDEDTESGDHDEPGDADVDVDGEQSAEQLAADDQLREGAQAYSQICASCHQQGGIGVVGQYPPLKDNPNVDDADYLRTVITTGRSGELEVDGVLYDGVMPSFSTLPDSDIEAIVAFVQNDFIAPATTITPQAGPIAGTELPGFVNTSKWLAYIIAGSAALLVLAPRITSANSRLSFPWLDVWLRTAIIVASVILLTVYIPDWAVRNSTVASLSRFSQDLIGVSLWLAGLGAVLWGLWYAHRESRL